MTITTAGVDFTATSYDEASETHRFDFDSATNLASMAVVAALSSVTETAPDEMEPLQATIDTDALDRLFRDETPGSAGVFVTFDIRGYRVTVHDTGIVEIEPVLGDRARSPNEEYSGQ